MKITKRTFNMYFGRRHVQELMDGWDWESFKVLPQKEQLYLIQFAREYGGQLGRLNELQYSSPDHLREAWRNNNRRRTAGVNDIQLTPLYEQELVNEVTPLDLLLKLEEIEGD